MLRLKRLTALEVSGNSLPSEFILFHAGVNDSEKGPVLFDEIAARSVMADYATRGVDLHIDLEHLSLEPWSPNYDPDARGWGQLEVREGDCWCVNVKWTPDGEKRLSERTQRYVSPAFYVDEFSRVTKVINVALTGLPATHKTPALVAANLLKRFNQMNADQVKALLEARDSGDVEQMKTAIDALIAAAVGGESADDMSGDAEALNDTGEPDPKATEDKKALSAAIVELRTLTGKSSVGEIVTELKAWGATLTEAQKRQDVLDLSSRKELVGQLVKLGVEDPATAWEGDPKDRVPVERLMTEPLTSLRSRVATYALTRNKTKPNTPPTSSPSVQLSKGALDYCKRNNITPEQYVIERDKTIVRGGVPAKA
jgi:phage I-like protein